MSTKTFDFKTISEDGYTILRLAIENDIRVTPELLSVSDINYDIVGTPKDNHDHTSILKIAL